MRATKELCFEAERRDMHVAALVDGLVASSGNELLSVALIEAAAALVAEPEAATTSEAVRTCVSFVLHSRVPLGEPGRRSDCAAPCYHTV